MSALWWVLIFGVVYPLVALLVTCLGTFGLSACKDDINAQIERNHRRSWMSGPSTGTFVAGWALRFAGVIAAGAVWPLAIPIYLSWKKGSFINDALAERARLSERTTA